MILPLIEKLAAIEHERWSDWHKYAVRNWNDDMILRWNKQANTQYFQLSESEQESDREQVRRYLPLIEEEIAHQKATIKELLEVLEKLKSVAYEVKHMGFPITSALNLDQAEKAIQKAQELSQ